MTPALLWVCAACALLNRARGSHFWGVCDTTEESRVLSMGIMAGLAYSIAIFTEVPILNHMISVDFLVLLFMALMLWCTPGWDAYWAAAIGNDPHHGRLWGLGLMTLRQLLGVPALLIAAHCSQHMERLPLAAGPILFGLPYFAYGFISKAKAVPWAEYTIGAMWGALFYLILT